MSSFAGRAGREGLAGALSAARLDADELDLIVGLDLLPRADDERAGVFLAAVFFAAAFVAVLLAVVFLDVAPARALTTFFLAWVFFAPCFDAVLFAADFLDDAFLAALFAVAFFGVEGFLAAVMGAGR